MNYLSSPRPSRPERVKSPRTPCGGGAACVLVASWILTVAGAVVVADPAEAGAVRTSRGTGKDAAGPPPGRLPTDDE
eukprot:CAMPEP_0175453836 /NCGR_PEP_ID=MMETSP0095-20121207/64166_1 /TAXON_ID=311494 /ORGANISM="Alexandrium monilatum, Strain CCMP3105" /LENGTH=76 /DNA_ID=CAMNT_0016754503 /DNA_START=11 /DNA_END=238 /DNA_ORIENTATION=+